MAGCDFGPAHAGLEDILLTMRDFDAEDEDVRQSELAEYEQEDRNMSDNAEG